MAEKSNKSNNAEAAQDKKRVKPLRLGRRTVWNVITHNWWFKLLAVFFAFILWGYVVSETNPRRPMTFFDVPIEIRGTDSLRGRKLAILTTEDMTTKARVELSVAYRDLRNVSKNNVTIVADVSNVMADGTYSVELRALTTGEVKSIEPSSITIVVEPMVTRQVPVRLKTVGKLQDGYWQGDADISNNRQIIIEGARSEVSLVSAALVEIPVGNRTKSFDDAFGFILVDENDMEVSASSVTPQIESVIVSIPILPTKEVPIRAMLDGEDRLAPYSEITGIDIFPQTVTIAGHEDVLETIDEIQLQPVLVADAATDISVLAGLISPTGVEMISQQNVAVTVHIDEIVKSSVIDDLPIARYPVRIGETVHMLETPGRIIISGLASVVDAFEAGDITLYVDESDLEPGLHTLPVQYFLTNLKDLQVQLFPKTVEVEILP